MIEVVINRFPSKMILAGELPVGTIVDLSQWGASGYGLKTATNLISLTDPDLAWAPCFVIPSKSVLGLAKSIRVDL